MPTMPSHDCPSQYRCSITSRTYSKQDPPSYHNITFWAMCCLPFFGFLRVSEFIIPTKGSYDPSSHLSLKDVAIDNRKVPRILQLTLKK